jgi:uncharacterized RDD family membrane protein YckC
MKGRGGEERANSFQKFLSHHLARPQVATQFTLPFHAEEASIKKQVLPLQYCIVCMAVAAVAAYLEILRIAELNGLIFLLTLTVMLRLI